LAIELKEFCGYQTGNPFTLKESDLSLTENNEAVVTNDCVFVDIEGIHSYPIATRNYTRYMPECLKKSVLYWTNPYERPLIKHHNEKDGKTIGRIVSVDFKEAQNVKGCYALVFTAMVPKEPEASDVQTGLLQTVSIGVMSKDVRCSICGQNIAEDGPCEHERGQIYENETCYWDIYDIEPKELSYVVVPSDMYAKNLKVYTKSSVVPKAEHQESVISGIHAHALTESGGNPNLDEKELNTKIEELTAAVKQAEEGKAAVEKELTDEKKKSEDLQKKIDAAAEEIQKIKDLIDAKDKELETSKAEVETITQQQESAEQQNVELREAYRTLLVSSFNFARQLNGKKELDEAAIEKRSNESLLDSFLDLKEDVQIAPSKIDEEINHVSNPGIPNLKEHENQLQTDKTELHENVNTHALLEDLFSSVM
jgi:hypothetical protein